MKYDSLVNLTSIFVEVEEGGIKEDTVQMFKDIKQESLSDEETSYTKLRLVNIVISANSDTVDSSIEAIYSVYHDFDKDEYSRFVKIMRKCKDNEKLSDDEILFFDDFNFDNIYLKLAAKASLLEYYFRKDKNNLEILKRYINEVTVLNNQAKEFGKNFEEDGYYVNNY